MMSHDAKSLLKAARRHGPAPDQEAKARMRSKILSTVAVTAASAASASAAASGSAGTTGAAASGVKGTAAIGFGATHSTALGLVKLGAVGALLIGGGTWVAARKPASSGPTTHVTHPAAPTVDLTANIPPVPVLPPNLAEGRDENSLAIPSASVGSATAKPQSGPPALHQASAVTHPLADPLDAPARVSEDSLSRERALLADARGALAAGDSNSALRILGEHASQFPAGVLASERRALTAMAYCGQGRLSDGLAMFPLPNDGSDTPLSAKVRAACR